MELLWHQKVKACGVVMASESKGLRCFESTRELCCGVTVSESESVRWCDSVRIKMCVGVTVSESCDGVIVSVRELWFVVV